MSLEKEQLQQLEYLIEEGYGSPTELANILDLGVEMLFYVEEDTFSRREIQQVASAIKGIVWVLRGCTPF
ncbi:hypothetical protein DX873_14235 [Flagellimonas nanhaiensis]|uniref:Uncharacterized protein n=1 Tax=Flagellimonas nanhaiensis TaxID=2292706 RepID=A0A371JNK8_9FLAO|nr:hypothetical protein DX873_14235 [Allomuricauda nanhaiensis]